MKRSGFFAVTLLGLLGGCSETLGPDEVAGTYQATTFTLSGDQTGDVLQEGGSVTMVLNANGSTSGTFVVPATLSESGTQETIDLSGTFTVEGDIVRFSHNADTFIRDVDWVADGNSLRASGTFSGTTVDIVMSRS